MLIVVCGNIHSFNQPSYSKRVVNAALLGLSALAFGAIRNFCQIGNWREKCLASIPGMFQIEHPFFAPKILHISTSFSIHLNLIKFLNLNNFKNHFFFLIFLFLQSIEINLKNVFLKKFFLNLFVIIFNFNLYVRYFFKPII